MNVTFVDLRTKSAEIIIALDRNETVSVYYRGRPKAIMQSLPAGTAKKVISAADHPACGMWADREDMKDVEAYVRRLRKGRRHDF